MKRGAINLWIGGAFLVCVALACVLGVLWLARRRSAYPETGRGWHDSVDGKATVDLVTYFFNPDSKRLCELGFGILLDDNLRTEEELEKGYYPEISAISMPGTDIPDMDMAVIRLKDRSDNAEHFRIYLAHDGIMTVIPDAAYHGEEYLPIARGENWYLVFSKRVTMVR